MKWEHIDDKLPKDSYYCFVCMGSKDFSSIAIGYYKNAHWCSIDRPGLYDIIYWKKIPYPKLPSKWRDKIKITAPKLFSNVLLIKGKRNNKEVG